MEQNGEEEKFLNLSIGKAKSHKSIFKNWSNICCWKLWERIKKSNVKFHYFRNTARTQNNQGVIKYYENKIKLIFLTKWSWLGKKHVRMLGGRRGLACCWPSSLPFNHGGRERERGGDPLTSKVFFHLGGKLSSGGTKCALDYFISDIYQWQFSTPLFELIVTDRRTKGKNHL